MLEPEIIQSLIRGGEGYNVEFKVRVPSKVRELTEEVCAFANTAGGYLFIGVDDNGEIVGVEVDNAKRSAIQGSISEISPALHCVTSVVQVEGKSLYVIEVPAAKNKPYTFSGNIFVREGANSQKLCTVEEIRSFFQECNKIYFDTIPCPDFDISTQADERNLNDFLKNSALSTSVPINQIFENLQLFLEGGVLKNAAVLFFGKHPERIFPHAVIRCVLFKGTDKVYIIDDKTFGGPLYQQYLQTMGWLESKLQLAYKIIGSGPREEVWEIPLTVFREALINALSHRDYYERGATITVEVFDDRVEVSNPGGLLSLVANDFGHKSMTRNPFIFELFTRMHLVEKIASGIPRMREAMEEAGLPQPEFHTEGIFTVVFKRNRELYEVNENDSNIDKRKNTQKVILDIIKNQPGVNASKVALIMGKDVAIVRSYLKYLAGQGIIEFKCISEIDGYFLVQR